MSLFSQKLRQRSGRASTATALEALEQRTFLNAAPIAPGFPDAWFPNGLDSEWPRHSEAAVYDGQVPTISITYDQMLALTEATDPEGDTIYFLFTASTMAPGGHADFTQPHGILDSNGNFLPHVYMDLAAIYDPDNNGVPNGDYVLEPGETWQWRGIPNSPFSGADIGPPWGSPPDTGIDVMVTDNASRTWSELPNGFISFTGNRSPQYTPTNGSPEYDRFELGHRGSVTLTFEEIMERLEMFGVLSDPENDQIRFVIQPGIDYSNDAWSLDKGTLTVGGENINTFLATNFPNTRFLPDHVLTPSLPVVLSAGESVTYSNTSRFQGSAFSIQLWDGLSSTVNSLSIVVQTSENTAPTYDEAVDLGTLDADRTHTWTFEELMTLLNATDADDDELTLRFEVMDDIGEVRINDRPFERSLLGPGDTITYTASGFRASANGFNVFLSDGWDHYRASFNFTDAAFAYGGALGDTDMAAGGLITAGSGGFPFGTHAAAWRNEAGELILSLENLAESFDDTPGARTYRNLSTEYGLPALTGDPVFTSSYGGQMYVPTADGLLAIGLLARQDTTTWNPFDSVYIRNLSVYNELVPASQLTLVTPPLGLFTTQPINYFGVVGYASGGDMVVMYSGEAAYYLNDPVKVFNITDAVVANSQAMPAFEAGFVAYAQAWGGYNVVGLDNAGDVIGVWTGEFYLPGSGGYNSIENSVWEVSNLSEITGAPVLTGALSVFSTAWNAINIIGTTQAGHAVASWWSPAMGAGNWSFVDFTQDFGGVPLEAGSLTGWVTPWGALNVAGVDDQGQTHVYWWVHTNISQENPAGWEFATLDAPAFSPDTRLIADSIYSYSGEEEDWVIRISIYGADENGRVGMTYWMPDLGGDWNQAWL
jgi:hypothetical protein